MSRFKKICIEFIILAVFVSFCGVSFAEEPLFKITDSSDNVILAVYPDGVKVYDDTSDSLMTILSDSIRIYRNVSADSILVAGKMSIGTTDPDSTFHVVGGAHITGGLKVDGGIDGLSQVWSVNGDSIYYNSGNVGIGTISPESVLEIYDGNLSIQRSDNTEDSNILFRNGGGWYNWRLYNEAGDGTDDFVIAGGNSGASPSDLTERFRIDSSGNVGICHTYSSVGLTVASDTNYPFIVETKSSDFLLDLDNIGNLSISGTYSESSDRRLKSNIQDLSYGLSDFMKIKPREYTRIDNPEDGRQVGFIAQELYEVFPEAVKPGSDEVRDSEKTSDSGYSSTRSILSG